MAIHPFQISDLNGQMIATGPSTRNGGAYASEFGILPDNINGNTSRYLHIAGTWANIITGPTSTGPVADSYGQGTGAGDTNNSSLPWRPNGGYFVRGLYFTGTAVPPSGGGFRDGYIGTFVGGIVETDYSHDANGSTVDYEPIYGHGAATWPMTADIPHQWLDSTSNPSDGTDSILNSSSALSRSIYMPASYMIFHIDSVGSVTTGSGNLQFHLENRPSLRMAGFSDGNGQSGVIASWAGTSTPVNFGASYPYSSDPLRNNGGLGSAASDNFHEYYQVTGVRKLNSRGLSFHMAKVIDNGFNSFAYPYEEDGITLGTGVTVSSSQIQGPQYTQVNNQGEYTWAGGRDKGASVISTSVSSNVVTIAALNNFSSGQIVLIQGLNAHPELNGALLTVLSGGLTSSQFTANWTHADYSTSNENSGGTAVFNPDFRVRNSATFIVNEEYYGLVMDTKCTIWSNKSSMFPMVFVDLADVWTGSAAKRIAGVSVVPTYINATQVLSYQVFFLSEDGKLARYDFTQTNGILELAGSGSFSFASNAAAPAHVGEAYGSMRVRSTTSTITATAISSNVLTVTCANSFEAGEVVNITGTAESFLNNQTVTVATASGTQFTAAYTHANFSNGSDTGSAVGYSLWAVYGTMTADPRTTQTGLVATARVGVLRYLVGTGVWGSTTFSPNTGRHNGRSLQEMISPRDSKLYILCEDVTVTGGGPFSVSNAAGTVLQINWQIMAYDPIAAAWNTSKINGGSNPLQYGISGTVNTSGTSVTWVSGNLFYGQANQPIIINGVTYLLGSVNNTTSITLQTSAGTQTGVAYSFANIGPQNTAPSQGFDFWFYNINAFLHDLGANLVMIQPNWTAGTLQQLDVSGSTAALTNSNLALVTAPTLFPGDAFIPSQSQPANEAVSIVHARDYATNADRTIFFLHQLARNVSATVPVYLAPPSYNWSSPTALSLIQRNSYGANPPAINSFDKDRWSYGGLDTMTGSFEDHFAFVFPTQLTDNYIHFIRLGSGADGLPSNSTYGRSNGQAIGFLPTYFKFTGGNWKMADSWTDAVSNPYTVGSYSGGYTTNIPLPYSLQVTFGPLSTTSWSQNEFHTFNMCYGNTKFARKLRSSWAQFAGQTFTNTETRTIAQETAITPYFIDTDPGTSTWTAPTSVTPLTASLTTAFLGWTTSAGWNKLDGANNGFDATPLKLVWTPKVFTTGTYCFVPSNTYLVTGSNPYSWTVGAHTYVASSSSQQGGGESWRAFESNPQDFWSAGGLPASVTIDLGSANAQTALSYGFRSVYNSSDQPGNNVPTAWTIQGSNDGTFLDNSGGPFILDTQSAVPNSRGYAFNVATPGSYRYYRMNITATSGSSIPQISCFRLSTAVLQTTVNFVDLVFYTYGSQDSTNYTYKFLQNKQFSRGYKFEVSTNGGSSYSPITPLWRAHNGYVYTFARQVGITNVRITVNDGYNYTNTQTAFGPFYLFDYNASQATLDAARLGIVSAPAGTAGAASFDPNCLGIATDVPNISIDGGNPSLLAPYSTIENGAVHGWWDLLAVQPPAFAPIGASSGCFKVHPFFGFTQFQNGGQDGSVQTITGTNIVLNYQWGRRI